MNTLLNVGDIIRIRDDIKENIKYEMILNTDRTNNWVAHEMLPAGTLVQIINVMHGQYRVQALAEDGNIIKNEMPDDFWSYTDLMFNPALLEIVLEDRYN